MFYSQFILAKKGPLGTIWIAAHLERKLRKNQVADTDIGVSVDSILDTDVPIALRLSSHLLLGVVRIYSRKVNYLFDDCSDALLKVKQAFRSTAVDLPPEQSKAPYHSITMPETFDLDDFELPDNEIFQGNDRHVSTREQITLQDTMDGVAFPTSQFGLDERFGDGDASQIGLDLDEDLFLEKVDAAGTSNMLNSTNVDQSSAKEATSFKDDEYIGRLSDPPLASSANYVTIQAPSTPGLMEEPNLPNDDHMDEDQNISELATKEVSKTLSSHVELSYAQGVELNSNGNCAQLDEQENEQAKLEISIFPNETVEATSPDDSQPLKSIEHIEVTSGVDSLDNKLEYIPLNNEAVAADGQSIVGPCEHDEAGLNGAGHVIFTEAYDQDTCVDGGKADINGSYLLDTDIRSEDNHSLVAQEGISSKEAEQIVVNNGYEKPDQPGQNLKNSVTSEYNGSENSLVFDTPVLKPCNSHNRNICGVEELPDASRLTTEGDGLCSSGLSTKQDTTHVEIPTDVHDLMMPTLKADEIAHGGADAITSSIDMPLNNENFEENHSKKENNPKDADFSAPEKLLSLPNLPTGQPNNILAEQTPGLKAVTGEGDCIEEVAADGDGSLENLLSGKKRSYTESTLTIQSLNSAASSSVAQSKQSVERVPEDDDLLTSILGGRSTAFKLKPSPAVTDSLPAKRQRTSIRSSAQKRKVLMDDSMVLHGDMIREQLTNTEDIRRVRKKAPCTRLEVWVLQKRFLEDEVFSKFLFTGLPLEFKCLHDQPRDLREIRVVHDDGSKNTNEMDTSAVGDKEMQVHEGSLGNTPSRSDSRFVVDALQKELETFDNEIAKQMSKQDIPEKKAAMENDDQAGGEGNLPVILTAEPASSVNPDPEVTFNLTDNSKVDTPNPNDAAERTSSVSLVPEVICDFTDNTKVDTPYPNETAELMSSVSLVPEVTCDFTDNTRVDAPCQNETTNVVVSAEIDASRQLLNQDCRVEFTTEDASTIEEVSISSGQNQEAENVIVDKNSDDVSLLEKMEGVVDKIVVMEDVQGTCPSPIHNIPVTNSVDMEDSASPTADRILEECHLGNEPRIENEEIVASDTTHDDIYPTSNNFLEEDVKLDPSCIPESDLGSHDMKLNEEDVQFLDVDTTLTADPLAAPTEFINPADHPDIGIENFAHDTDFLNVDDDDVDEDYENENDAPNPEEKRMLDNSGWSSRTRAVANYLQVLFEKETHPSKKVIPLESLLSGKTRKEASRMFFETLVLTTKDYIHAEQDGSFCNIKIKPTGKLTKSEF